MAVQCWNIFEGVQYVVMLTYPGALQPKRYPPFHTLLLDKITRRVRLNSGPFLASHFQVGR